MTSLPQSLRPLVRGRLPAGFDRRVVTIPAGGVREYAAQEWRDAVVVLVSGRLDLEGASGRRYGFGAGAVLRLAGLPLRALHNPGPGQAVLVAVSRTPRGPPATPAEAGRSSSE